MPFDLESVVEPIWRIGRLRSKCASLFGFFFFFILIKFDPSTEATEDELNRIILLHKCYFEKAVLWKRAIFPNNNHWKNAFWCNKCGKFKSDRSIRWKINEKYLQNIWFPNAKGRRSLGEQLLRTKTSSNGKKTIGCRC